MVPPPRSGNKSGNKKKKSGSGQPKASQNPGAKPAPKQAGKRSIKRGKGSSKRHKKASNDAISDNLRPIVEDVEGYTFNFKWIKDRAKAGSWRRGYGYFKTPGQVLNCDATENGIVGQVKGNYKDAYNIELVFTPTKVEPNCDCPLDEPWCKHAIAVALQGVHSYFWDKYFDRPDEAPTTLPPLDECDADGYMGSYRFLLDWNIKPKALSIQIYNRPQKKLITHLDRVLKEALAMQKAGQFDVSPQTKRELLLIQFLYKHGVSDTTTGWVHVSGEEREALISHLSTLEELGDARNNMKLVFDTRPLGLMLSVNASMAGNVLAALHWVRHGEPEEVLPLEEVELFARTLSWGVYQGRIYPLKHTLRHIPNYLTRSTFYDIRDAEGGKFVFEELPKLRNYLDVEQAEVIDKAFLEQEPPRKVLKIRRVGVDGIRAELEFNYEGTVVPYSKSHEAPYVTVINKKEETIYWLKRDRSQEEKACKLLLKGHMEHLQSNHFMAEGDKGIDFINYTWRQLLNAQWTVEAVDDFSDLALSRYPIVPKVWLDFSDESVDEFTLCVGCAIGYTDMDLETVQQGFTSGKKYIMVPDQGYVEIPLVSILQFNKTLNMFDKEVIDVGRYAIKTYQAGLIAEFEEQGCVLDMTERFAEFWHLITSFNELEEVDVPENINVDLRPYQKKGFNWLWFLYKYGLNGILADDMGLGKTIQALVTLQKAKNEDGPMPTLIICPTSVVYNWERECKRFTPELSVMVLSGYERHHNLKKIHETDVIITSYALLRRDFKILRQFQFRYIILDESQHIKNIESQTAQASKQLNSLHRLALSGTPIENRLSELWSAFDFLMPNFLLDLNEFRYRYITPIEERTNRDAERRLKRQISPFILRRLKRDVAKDLPDKIENTIFCELLPEQQELYLDVLEKTRTEVYNKMAEKGTGAVGQAWMLSSLLRLRQTCCHPKLLKDYIEHSGINSGKFQAFKELIDDIICTGHKVLVFSQFVEMLDIMKAWIESEGVPYEYLTGSTKDRQERVDRFNRDPDIPIFLISLKAGGTGLNLTGADYVIHYDPWWNPAAEDQATDRAYRIGQTRNVFVYRFITKGTVEEKIEKLKDRKRSLVDTVISVDRGMNKSLSFDDLKDILTPGF